MPKQSNERQYFDALKKITRFKSPGVVGKEQREGVRLESAGGYGYGV